MSRLTYYLAWGAAWLAIALGFAMILTAPGCVTVSKPGDSCPVAEAYCTDSKNVLACEDGHYKAFPCPGPQGCFENADRDVLCDQTAAVADGMACPPPYEGLGECSADATQLLVCSAGKWTSAVCPDGTSCKESATGVGCM